MSLSWKIETDEDFKNFIAVANRFELIETKNTDRKRSVEPSVRKLLENKNKLLEDYNIQPLTSKLIRKNNTKLENKIKLLEAKLNNNVKVDSNSKKVEITPKIYSNLKIDNKCFTVVNLTPKGGTLCPSSGRELINKQTTKYITRPIKQNKNNDKLNVTININKNK